MKRIVGFAASIVVLLSSVTATAQTNPPRDGARIFFLRDQALPQDVVPPTCQARQTNAGPQAAPLLPILFFVANMLFQEGLEALSRREERRLESFSNDYGARGNAAGLPDLPLAGPTQLPQTPCLAVENWAEGALTSRFIFELRALTPADFSVRPLYAHILSSPVVEPSGVNTINTSVMLGFTAIVGERCPGDPAQCGVRRAEILGSPSFNFRSMTVGQPVRCFSGQDEGCSKLGDASALLPRPLVEPAPMTIAATVTEASTRLRRAKLQNAIWERQRAHLLEALNAVVQGALGDE